MADEKFLDMATALSGTGPAYVFLFMEALVDAGVHMGFSRRDAEKLVLQTVRGSVDYAQKSGLHLAETAESGDKPRGNVGGGDLPARKGRFENGFIAGCLCSIPSISRIRKSAVTGKRMITKCDHHMIINSKI